jgi:RHS repeat-associated protein
MKPSDGICTTRWTTVAKTPLQQDPLDPDCTADVQCVPPPLDSKNLGAPDSCSQQQFFVGNPINAGTGNKFQSETDYQGAGLFPLAFTRNYNSQSDWNGGIGQQWLAHGSLVLASPTSAVVTLTDNRTLAFNLVNGQWQAAADAKEMLAELKDGNGATSGWELTREDGVVQSYNSSGNLSGFRHPTGLTHSIAGLGTSQTAITDSFGRSIVLNTNTANRITTLTDPASGTITYTYDTAGNLSTATYPDLTPADSTDNPIRTYHYEDSRYPHALTGITDENGDRFATYGYDDHGRATLSEHAGGAERVELVYNEDGSSTVTDALGTDRTRSFSTILDVVKGTGISQPGGAGCGASSSALGHDANGNVTTRDDFNGHRTKYWHDQGLTTTRNLETTRTEGLGLSNGSETVLPETRTFTTAWHPTWRLPVTEKTYAGGADSAGTPLGDLLKTVASTYDDATGNLLTRSETDNARNETRTWTYTWATLGRLKTADGPRTDVNDVTTYDYYPDDDPDLARRGQRWKVTNALGHVTEILAYDLHGHPTQIKDPNGLITEYTYTPRGWLQTRLVGDRLTSYTYDKVGQLTRIDLPDGSWHEYTFDAAHRLTDIRNAQGDHIHYDLDLQGNIQAETAYDAEGNQASKLTREYDALGRLWKEIRRINGQDATTEYAYDAQGNPTLRTDPLTHATHTRYDALDRLAQTEDALQGLTDFALDSQDSISAITDPKRLTTAYEVDAFGQTRSETSPDRGITSYTYDPAGNLKTRTDARGKKLTYSYDALNRLTKIDRPTSPDNNYTWDQGDNGLGRLTGIGDETGNTAWTYNEYGEVTLKSQNHVAGGTLTRSVASTYQNARLTRLDYPSGAALDYVWSQGRVTEIKLNGVALLKDIRYRADGQPLGWTWGNERAYTRSFDSETGWLNGHPLGSDTRTLETDLAGRITSTLHVLKPANDQVYGYDDLDRLTNQSNQQGSTAWLYDPNGNRTLHQSGATDYAYAIAPDSNRLQSMAGPIAKSFEYDATGNILSDGTYGFTYNDFGRLSKLTRLTKSTTYRYNALGERVQKEGQGASNGPVRFVYDNAHRLLGEYDKSGNRQQETVWLGDLPVAALTPAGTLYVHADHLNTPRVLMDADDRAVWRWDSDAFGVGAAQEDPDADKRKVVYNLRLPGQYFDSESGLHYNLFRDYDPRSGRYVQSDPIGMAGGSMSLYAYADNAPTIKTDPLGLFAEMCYRPIQGYVIPGQHCFVRFDADNNNTSSFTPDGTGPDASPKGATCEKAKGPEDDSCVKREMKKCQNYGFLGNNCCHCAEQALKACGQSIPPNKWPNWPINPGPQLGEPGYKP